MAATSEMPRGGGSRRAIMRIARAILIAVAVALALVAWAGGAGAAPAGAAPASGSELWRKVVNGPGAADDAATAIAFAPGGTAIYVAGSVGAAGGTTDIALAKYLPGGKRAWLRTYDGSAHTDDAAAAVVVDAAGNIYVGGLVHRAYNSDMVLIKYDSAGRRKWVRFYDGFTNGQDSIEALALDAHGNVYAAGASFGDHVTPNLDAAVGKWTPSGKRSWLTLYDGPGSQWDGFTAIVVDRAHGRVYASGKARTSMSDAKWVVARLTTGGAVRWARLHGADHTDCAPPALALARDGGVLQAGSVLNGSNWDAEVVKWTAAGDVAWSSGYSGSMGDRFLALAVDRQGAVFAVGYATTALSYEDALVCRFTPAGTPDGDTPTIGSFGFNDRFTAVTCDKAGNVYAAGFEGEAANDTDVLTAKLSNDLGRVYWQPRAREQNVAGDDAAAAIVVRTGTRAGVYVTGFGARDASTSDWMTIKYKP